MDRFTYEHILSPPSASTTKHSTAATCHDIDIEGVAEERVVVGDDELYIQHYSHHIH